MRILFLHKKRPMATEPVCHMEVATDKPPGGTWEHAGETSYFCGPGCNRAFQKGPQACLSGEKLMHMGE